LGLRKKKGRKPAKIMTLPDGGSQKYEEVWEPDDPEDGKLEYGPEPCSEKGGWWTIPHEACRGRCPYKRKSHQKTCWDWCGWLVLVVVAEWGMMGICRPMSSPYMFPTSVQQYSIIPTAPINHHRPPLYQQHPYAPMSIQRLSSIPGDCFRSIKPSTLSSVQAQPISI